jgi:hypothetical protein
VSEGAADSVAESEEGEAEAEPQPPGNGGRGVLRLRLLTAQDRVFDSCRMELQAFLKCRKLERKFVHDDGQTTIHCPLLWWKKHAVRFPVLAVLARQWLAIPATSAPSERVFSHAGLTIANDRASLLPENAELLILLHDTWPVVEAYLRAKRARMG